MLPNNILRWLTLLVGLGSIAAGIDYLGDPGEDRVGQALLILFPFGLAMIAVAIPRLSARGSAEAVTAEDGGTVFRATAGRSRAGLIGLAGFTCVGLGMALFPGPDSPNTDITFVRFFGGGVALLFGVLLLLGLLAAARGPAAVVLTPEGITQEGRLRSVHVAWDEITGIGAYQWRGAIATVLQRPGGDVHVPLQMMGADPAAFHALVQHMHAHPEDRPRLAAPGGPDVLARFGGG